MGDFRITIEAVGGHGCQRHIRDGGVVGPCEDPRCPDCQARRLVTAMLASGTMVRTATLTHWPGQECEVVDDLQTGVRRGSFTF